MKAMPKVSVVILTFNHRNYVRQAVDSVLAQHVDFPIEIVIGDDCSTDGTSAIVDELAAAHPDTIIVERPERNGGFHANFRRCFDRCRGYYVALLESDDYWVDPSKLGDQVAQLDSAPAVDIGFTQGWVRTGEVLTLDFDWGPEHHLVPFRVLLRGRGMIAPTASLVIRRRALGRLPGWLDEAPVLDIFLLIAMAWKNGAAYLARPTVVYRSDASGNWSSGQLDMDWSRKARSAETFLRIYRRQQRELGIPARYMTKRLSYFHWVIARQALRQRRVGAFLRAVSSCDLAYLAGRLFRFP